MLPSNIDIFTYSFPCQDISQQGKQKGINEQTRSGLLLQVKRILEINKDN
ncbi:DNA cytosine methyltransferase, partial [Mycoplasmopsis felis]